MKQLGRQLYHLINESIEKQLAVQVKETAWAQVCVQVNHCLNRQILQTELQIKEGVSKVKTFKQQIAQGDLLITRIATLPAYAVPVSAAGDDKYILSHSETGHHHAITAAPSIVQLFGSENPLVGYLSVRERSVELRHERDWDTHESIQLEPGFYELRRQREHAPDGWRRVQD